ncbi:hypothetical protein MPTK1_6g03440 [Marchantia polymorpha subsp. ruderalis]|uniref:Uncharacterized protein n=2 Tax=Marchantia polymorpha TaxID=3197 RepID=A0AAF6BN50_MARPO|nr:hypothetical protein MARPO_0035s0124 [Marchantia polymorpha]BBN13434.1 hypothetical protein Mp_6g03440 [Marchantia polymorpha subsp. ruderalis]|eukprot:PTQ41355.1 hypothetical protein MARPO_0035s0124 [Marchantia polymorpha]
MESARSAPKPTTCLLFNESELRVGAVVVAWQRQLFSSLEWGNCLAQMRREVAELSTWTWQRNSHPFCRPAQPCPGSAACHARANESKHAAVLLNQTSHEMMNSSLMSSSSLVHLLRTVLSPRIPMNPEDALIRRHRTSDAMPGGSTQSHRVWQHDVSACK